MHKVCLLAFTITLVVILEEIKGVSALKCFQCDASTCDQKKEYWAQQKCKQIKYCVKEYKDGSNTILKRGCAKIDPGKPGCKPVDGIKKCYCTDDFCNAAEER